jgi:hypothetical protein
MPIKSINQFLFEQANDGRKLPEGSKLQGIIDDFIMGASAAMENAGDDVEAKQAIIAEWLKQRPHLFVPEATTISEEKARAAFGEKPTLAAQAALVKTYGEDEAKAEASRWGTSLGSLKPGRLEGEPDPETVEKIKAKAKAEDDEGPSRNPWQKSWSPGGVRSPDERAQLRLEAQSRVIRTMGTAGASRMARAAGVTLGGLPLARK